MIWEQYARLQFDEEHRLFGDVAKVEVEAEIGEEAPCRPPLVRIRRVILPDGARYHPSDTELSRLHDQTHPNRAV